MQIIVFSHPGFGTSQSMPRFTRMLVEGMIKMGHTVEVWSPQAKFFTDRAPLALRKWLGYIDQYIVFPKWVQNRLRKTSVDTLFVFADNALGPWVPLVADRPHVVHCHDFLAQRSALNEIPENPTSCTGKLYQKYIRRGYSKGKNFISVSNKTREDLHRMLDYSPAYSEVIYNGLNTVFTTSDPVEARKFLGDKIGLDLASGYLLHVGGNQWYKNRQGVLEIYTAWRSESGQKQPLIMIGEEATQVLLTKRMKSAYQNDIHFLHGVDNQTVQLAYAGASVFLFPSLAEGFGWPIAEAMFLKCPVITTDEAPMTEVAGTAGFFISRCPADHESISCWASDSAKVLDIVTNLSPADRMRAIQNGRANAERFNQDNYLDKIELAYQTLVQVNGKDDIKTQSLLIVS